MNETNKDLIIQFKLPGYIKGKSFAEASQAINKKFEGRNDITSKTTKAELLNRLAQAQEYLKSQEQPEVSQNEMAWGGFEDSMIGQGFQEGATGAEQGAAVGAGINTLTGAIDLGKLAFGKAQQDTSGEAESAEVNAGNMIGGAAIKGASAGAALGPVGAGVGALIGGVAGLLGSRKAKRAAIKNSNNFAFKQNKQFSDNYAMGGVIDPPVKDNNVYNTKTIVKYQPGVTSGRDGSSGFYLYSKLPTEAGFNVERDREFVRNENMGSLQRTPQWQAYMKSQNPAVNKNVDIKYSDNITTDYKKGGEMSGYGKDSRFLKPKISDEMLNPYMINNILPTIGNNPNYSQDNANKLFLTRQANIIGDNPDNISTSNDLKDKNINVTNNKQVYKQNVGELLGKTARYAPALMNAIQLAKLKKPEGVVLNKLNNRYKPTYADLAQQQNIVNQELNNTNAAIQQSGASQGASRAAMLGAQLNKTRALSNAYAQAQAQNAQQDNIAQQFNLGIDQTNLQQANLQQDINDRNMGNYDTQKSKLISQLGTDIGNIGKEQLFKQYPKMMGLGYNWNGKYFVNEKGDIKTKEEAAVLESNKKATGGYLNKDVLNYINTSYMKRNKK